jgi:DNA adenine methylase
VISAPLKQQVLQSPLRYPGGKRRLSSYIAEILRAHDLRPKLFAEAFAGGASVSIAMLENDLVDEIALADRDRLVAAFWRVVFSPRAQELADACLDVEADLDAWRRFKTGFFDDDLQRAVQCLFLNRTSFSGILNQRAGPLGGWTQSARTLDCRFPRDRLADRILELSKLQRRVRFVREQSWRRTVAHIRTSRVAAGPDPEIFWYLDPPFFHKADRLYRHFFNAEDHAAFATVVPTLPGHWLISYDAAEEVRALYSDQTMHVLDMVYTARRQDRAIAGREILVSDLQLPGLEAATRRSQRIRLAVLDGDGPVQVDTEASPAPPAAPVAEKRRR